MKRWLIVLGAVCAGASVLWFRAPGDPAISAPLAGALDPSFGTNGTQTTGSPPFGVSPQALAMTIDANGRVVVVGKQGNFPNAIWTLARYTITGTLDSTFGNSGTFVTGISGDSRAQAVVIQPSGRIVAGGSSQVGGRTVFQLVGYTPNATPPTAQDLTFGVNGFRSTDFGGTLSGNLNGLALDSSARIYAAGQRVDGTTTNMVVTRYTVNGALDTTFGNSGVYVVGFNGSENANAILVLSDNSMLLVGTTTVGGNLRCLLVKLAPNASPPASAIDTTFGVGGFLTINPSGIATANARCDDAVQLPNGQFLVTGTSSQPTERAFVTRVNANGTIDTTYGTSGSAIPAPPSPITRTESFEIALQSNGKAVIGGRAWISPTSSVFLLARLTTASALDTSFGSGGYTTTGFDGPSSLDFITGMELPANGAIVAVGSSFGGVGGKYAIARYFTEPSFQALVPMGFRERPLP